MGNYEVIHFFTDLQDFDHPYRVGDSFPRTGMRVSEARIQELLGSNNKQHKPLIKAVGEEILPFSDNDITFEEHPEEQLEEKQYTKTEINSMKTAELQELAEKVGIEDAYETSGVELKRRLAEYFNL